MSTNTSITVHHEIRSRIERFKDLRQVIGDVSSRVPEKAEIRISNDGSNVGYLIVFRWQTNE